MARQLTKEQRRQLESNPVMIATMRRVIEEQHNDLANLVTRSVADTVKPLIINTICKVVNRQAILTGSTQIQIDPVRPAIIPEYVSQPNNTPLNFGIVGQSI